MVKGRDLKRKVRNIIMEPKMTIMKQKDNSNIIDIEGNERGIKYQDYKRNNNNPYSTIDIRDKG